MSETLVDHLASYGIRRLPNNDLQLEIDFARRERDLAEPGSFREYQAKRLEALTKEQNRRKALRERIKPTGLTVDYIRDLKARVDIRDIFNDVLGILVVPSGTERERYACPAHPDKHPSGVVYVKDQRFHCFQCHADGDVYDSLMAFRGMTFMQAVNAVTGYLGEELPKPKGTMGFER